MSVVCRKSERHDLDRRPGRLWFTGVWLLAAAGALSDLPAQDFQVRNWHMEDGLPDATVTALAQTPDGYLWVGTPRGLVRFDGTHFRVFDEGSVTGLPEAHIAALHVDRHGTLWVAGIQGSLAKYGDGGLRTISPAMPVTTASGNETPSDAARSARWIWKRVSEMAEDSQGAVWLVCPGQGLVGYSQGKTTLWSSTNGLPAGEIDALCSDNGGNLWLATEEGLYRKGDDRWEPFEETGLHGPMMRLAAAKPGGIWVAAPHGSWVDGGGSVRRLTGERWDAELAPTPWTPNSLRSQVTSLLEDRNGHIWLGTLWGGLYCSDQSGPWRRVATEGAFSQCVITCLFEDREGAVWAGTVGEGLHRIARRPVAVVALPAPATENIVTTSTVSRDGSIWIGTDGAGAFRYRELRFTRFDSQSGLTNHHVCSLLEDQGNDLWAGTWGGLFKFDKGRFARMPGPPELSLPVLSLFQDRAGGLWIGTPQGPVRYDGSGFQMHRLLESRATLDIRSFAEDNTGAIWVGTIGHGLFKLSEGSVQRFGPAQGFSSENARSLLVDLDGTLWVGSDGAGLFRLKKTHFEGFDTSDGLPSDTISSIINDGAGNLWMGSDNGIFVCATDLLSHYQRGRSPALLGKRIGLDEGLISRGCSGSGQPVSCQSRDGRMWFPNMRGLAVFSPKTIVAGTKERSVLVEAVLVDGTQVHPDDAAEVRVPSTTRRFEFHYTAPDLTTPQALRFRHRLEGMDDDWVEAGGQRVAYYSRLPPGRYHFRVMVGGPEGSWQESRSSLALRIVPRWWELQAVQILAGLALAGGVAGIMVLNERRKLRRRLDRLEFQQALEAERRRIARDLHDDLGSRLTEIVLLGELAKRGEQSPGILQRQLSGITHKVRELVTAMQEVVWTINPRNDSLSGLATYLCDHTERFLTSAELSCRLDVPETLPDVTLSANVRHNLLLGVKEALNNAVRHAGATTVQLRVWLGQSRIHVSVQDDGCGFDPGVGSRQGNGLSNMRNRMDSIGGTVSISGEPGKGATVSFVIPVESTA